MRSAFLILALSLVASGPVGAHDTQARYLGNEGVMVASGDTKILFDAFYAESFGGTYTLVPTDIEQKMMAGEAPFDGVDALFISHIHPDHFNSRKVIAYMRAHPQVRLYAGMDVVGAIRAADASSDPLMERVTAIHVPPGEKGEGYALAGLMIEPFSIPHNGDGPIPHYAFRVTLDESATVMHLGDATATEKYYAPYQRDFDARRTHVAFAPTWLMTSESGKRILEQRIRADTVIGMHAEDKARGRKVNTRRELDGDVFLDPGEERDIRHGH